MKKLFATFIVVTTFFINLTANASQKITVFAAASLTDAMQEIGQTYQAQNREMDIVFSFASSSVLARQIEQGAPADIFISADQKWMDYLIDHQVVEFKQTLLKNDLVLIAPITDYHTPVTINQQTDWRALLPSNEKLAIGDPDHVPAGIYAKESLTNLGVYDQLVPQFARASNVRDALMLVERQEAALGIVYSTDAKVSQKVKILGTFPTESFKPIEYPITLLNPVASQFYEFLQSETAKHIFQKYGFVTL
ncbi:molybdate ABC transporter substrate-binding protein [Frischella sp. Ac13]|uniref:Molybdate ABC transporter substrate-binding protein n=1 Tax=Frischella japonica TaxID=2741544 RepID=A0ABR7QYX9_9GAMM|nr:molybdate ABC transporter substrate-binding protein [Frischella japonica]MBC9131266.1 molybdate ABC transporter substrate-binding protein [Frischella japonica]